MTMTQELTRSIFDGLDVEKDAEHLEVCSIGSLRPSVPTSEEALDELGHLALVESTVVEELETIVSHYSNPISANDTKPSSATIM